jgi:hypothetical protein
LEVDHQVELLSPQTAEESEECPGSAEQTLSQKLAIEGDHLIQVRVSFQE